MASRSILRCSMRCNCFVALKRHTLNGTLRNVRHVSSSLRVSSVFPVHSTSLGLYVPFIQARLDTIRELPEIESALRSSDSKNAAQQQQQQHPQEEDLLKRGVDVFGRISSGSKEHQAALALLAHAQHSRGHYEAAIATLGQLEKTAVDKEETIIIKLAQSKAHWLHGDLTPAKEICDELLDDQNFPTPLQAALHIFKSPLQAASVLSANAILRLFLAEISDDAFSMRDPFRMAVIATESHPTPSLGAVAALLNMGVAEAVYAEIVSRSNVENDHGFPLDAALRNWKQGLTMFKRFPKLNKQGPAAQLLQAKLAYNMAWGILSNPNDMMNHTDNVKMASEYTAQSLGIYDKLDGDHKEGLGRVLTLTASCCQQSGAAVTAQGLLESAIDQPCIHAPQKLQVRESYTIYSGLCQEWERRERDAEKLQEKANEVNASLPTTWKSKSVIHESLWFWTPYSFHS